MAFDISSPSRDYSGSLEDRISEIERYLIILSEELNYVLNILSEEKDENK